MARYENKTIMTMTNDYQGDSSEFAMIIPVPTVLERFECEASNLAMLTGWELNTIREKWPRTGNSSRSRRRKN
jgi:hypothetical protein